MDTECAKALLTLLNAPLDQMVDAYIALRKETYSNLTKIDDADEWLRLLEKIVSSSNVNI